MKAVIYTRVSSNEQVKGTSLKDQEEKCRAYCDQNGIEVLRVFREEGESAKSSDRTEFLQALEFCRKNKGNVNIFVVLKVDRFARNTEDHFAVRKNLLDSGVSLHSVTEPIGNDPVQKLLETVLAGTAEFDNAIRAQRSVNGMISRVRDGITPWKSPIGYLSNRAKSHGKKKNVPDRIDPVIFPIIQGALKRFARGELAQVDMLAYLDQEGLEKARGKKTTKQMVDKIVNQYLKFYAGIIVNPWVEGEETKGMHKPMITEGELNQIIAIRQGKMIKKQPRQRFNPSFPLKKTLRCGECGKRPTGSFSRGNGGRFGYYSCYKPGCSLRNKTIEAKTVHEEFIALLGQLRPSKEHLTLLKESVLDLLKEKQLEYSIDAKKSQGEIAQLEARRRRIFEMLESGSYNDAEFQERKAEVENELAAKRISKNESSIDQLDIEATLSYATQFVEHLDRQWVDLKDELKPRFQQLIFPEGISYFKGQGFGTAKTSLMLEQQKTRHEGESLVVTSRRIELRFRA